MTNHTFRLTDGRRPVAAPISSVLLASVLLALLAAVPLLFGYTHAEASPQQQAPVLPPSAANGQPLYQENCAPCHGATGWGDGPTATELPQGATALADPAIARLATPVGWFEVIKEGRMMQFMPPWNNRLSDEQIWDVAAYSLFLHTSQAELAQGEAIWGQQCAACHGVDGTGNGPEAEADGMAVPNLADPGLTVSRSLDDWHAVTSAGQGAMPAFAGALSDAEIWAAVQHARSFTFQPLVVAVVPAGAGRLTGQVVNGSTGEPISATVTLNTFESFQQLQTKQVQTDAEGAFAFEELPIGSQYAYLVTTAYGDSTFGSDVVTFPAGQEVLTVPLTVYETSATPGEIRVNLAQWFVDNHQGALLVGELYRIAHDSDTVYVGSEEVAPGKKAVLRFNLPAGATSVALDGGELGGRFIRTADGIVDTQPLQPGGAQILLRYLLPYSGSSAELANSVSYPVDRLSVLVVDGPKVATSLQSLGAQTVADQQWNSFEGANLPAGQAISLRLTDLARVQSPVVAPPGASGAVVAYSPGLLIGVGIAALVAVLGVLGAYILLKPKQQAASQAAPAGAAAPAPATETNLVAERQRLLAAIAELDDLHAAGGLDEESYQRARAAKKRSLLLVSKQLQQGAQSEP
jgi:mono/diheme cytochrome c family protein